MDCNYLEEFTMSKVAISILPGGLLQPPKIWTILQEICHILSPQSCPRIQKCTLAPMELQATPYLSFCHTLQDPLCNSCKRHSCLHHATPRLVGCKWLCGAHQWLLQQSQTMLHLVGNSSSAWLRGEFVPWCFGQWLPCKSCEQIVPIGMLSQSLYFS